MRRILVTMSLCAAMANLGGCVLALGNGDGSNGDASWSSSDSTSSSLAKAVRANLNSNPVTEAADLTVYADHDRIKLTGTVHSSDVLEKAVQLALDTPGVAVVNCRIVVTH
jgi:osmotically-inducible protein OsmY